jgi:HEPN domain-containing protein
METEFNEWANCPITLSPYEIKDPFIVIEDFFSADSLSGHLKVLQKWRDHVIGGGYFTDVKGNPSSLLFTHELNVKLIEAAMVLKKPFFSEILMQYDFHDLSQIIDERVQWAEYPNSLSEAELLNPFLIIRSFFRQFSLAEYRAHLDEWLTYALSSKPANEFVTTKDLTVVYENLQKLYNVMWVYHNRHRATQSPSREKSNDITDIPPISLYELDSFPEASDREKLSGIVGTIKHKLPSTWAIIYLGEKPGNHNLAYLLVLTADHEQGEATSLGAMLEESCLPAKIHVLVHYATAVLNAINYGDRFFSRAFTCPALYLSGDLLLPKAKLAGKAFNFDLGQANWERWHKQAKEFLRGAEYYLSVDANSAALFSLHQSAECILIAIVRAVLGYRINSHNLLRLLRVTQIFTNDLTLVFDLDSNAGKANFHALKEAYINVRYRDNYEPDAKALEALFPIVSKLVLLAERVHRQFLMSIVL